LEQQNIEIKGKHEPKVETRRNTENIQSQPTRQEEKPEVQPIDLSEENRQINLESISIITQTLDIDSVEIKSNSDLANYIILSINRLFEPFWGEYTTRFDPTKFTVAGKVSWDDSVDSKKRQLAREPINRMKNIECIHLYRLPFTTKVTDEVSERVNQKISGVSRQLIRSGVRKHIRLMVTDLIYRNRV